MFTTSAASAHAASGGVHLANIDKSLQLRKKSVIAAPIVIEKNEYYKVRGDSEKELQNQMCHNGCTWSDGKTYDSITSWHVRWDYGYVQTPKACSADSFRATIEITYHYPQWVQNDKAPRPLVDKWVRFMKNLIAHEQGHRDIAVKQVAELSRAVAEMPPAPTCADIDRNVRDLCRVQLKKLQKDSNEYDEITRHGLTQGAVFP